MAALTSKLVVRILGLVLFLITLVTVPLFQIVGPPQENLENRTLASQPAWPDSRQDWLTLPKAFAAYMDDNFGFRSQLLRTHNRLMVSIGSSPSEKVILGKDGWLFYNFHQLTEQHRGAMPLSDQQLMQYSQSLREQRQWVEQQGIAYRLLPTPDKNSLFPEKMPDWTHAIGPSRFDQVREKLKAANEPFVDVLPTLQTAKQHDERIYLQTDTHWSCLGAFRAYEVLMESIEPLNLAGVRRLTEADITFTALPPGPGRDMSRNMLLLKDIVLESLDMDCSIIDPPEVEATRLADGFIAALPYVPKRQQERWQYDRKTTANGARLLLYRDSYSHALIPFLIATFDQVTVVPRPQMDFSQKDFVEHPADLVIFQFVERALLWEPKMKANE